MTETSRCRRQRARAARRVHRPRAAPRRPRGARRPDAGPERSAAGTPSSARSSPPTAPWRDRRGTTSPRPASWPPRTSRSPPRCRRSRRPPRRLREHLRHLLVPRDPDDDRDVILEVKAGEGGEESALFAGDLLRMYLRYAEKPRLADRGHWTPPSPTSAATRTRGWPSRPRAAPPPGEASGRTLKYEGGVHRVQRVPVTESQGRIHTSAAGVLVMPEVEETSRSRSTRTTCASTSTARPARAARASTRPTPRSGSPTCRPASSCRCQNEKSQLQNKEQAMRILRARLPGGQQEQADGRRRQTPSLQVRTVDRCERIRTYNFAENRHLRPPDGLQGLQPRPGARR